jgi:dihydroorotate dehydrogenase electron transfer subunit
MKDAAVIIERIRRAAPTVQRVEVAVEMPHKTVQPGQFFLARVTESLDPYLREPWTPIRKKGAILTFERPVSVTYQPGQVISLLGPLGKPFALRDAVRTLLLIAFDSAPISLLMLAEEALERRVSVTLLLMGAARGYPLEALPPEIEVVRGDEKGQIAPDYLRWADQVVTVAPDASRYPQLFEAAQRAKIELPPNYLCGVHQLAMPCGVGACGACAVRCKGGERLACIDGPVFDLTEVSL